MFAIYVSYYIKVKLALSGMGGEVSLKLPFILGHVDDSDDDEADKLDKALAPRQGAANIIEEECGHEEGGANILSALLQQCPTQHDVETLATPSKNAGHLKNGSRANSENIVSFENDPDDADALENKLKSTHVATTSDVDTEPDGGSNEHTINVITAQIHHHQPPNEEPTDC